MASVPFRVQCAVANNYPAVLEQYNMAGAIPPSQQNPSPDSLVRLLNTQVELGHSAEVMRIITVPYIMGQDDTMDRAYTSMLAKVVKGRGEQPQKGGAPKFAWIAAIAEVAGSINSGIDGWAATERAATDEINAQANANADAARANADRSARMRETWTYIGIGLAVVAVVVLLIWYKARRA